MSKQLIVELTGLVRVQAGLKEVSIAVNDNATWGDVVAALARALPALVSTAIAEHQRSIAWPYLLNVGGRRTIRDFGEKAQLQEGDHLSLLEETC